MSKVRDVKYITVKCLRKSDGPVTVQVVGDDGRITEVPLKFEDGQYVYRAIERNKHTGKQ